MFRFISLCPRGGGKECQRVIRRGGSWGKGWEGSRPTLQRGENLDVTFSLFFFFGDGIKLAQSSKCVINTKTLPEGEVP